MLQNHTVRSASSALLMSLNKAVARKTFELGSQRTHFMATMATKGNLCDAPMATS